MHILSKKKHNLLQFYVKLIINYVQLKLCIKTDKTHFIPFTDATTDSSIVNKNQYF